MNETYSKSEHSLGPTCNVRSKCIHEFELPRLVIYSSVEGMVPDS